MRIDVVTILPDYLAPLGLSLIGKARDAGLLDVRVHDLRKWTHDPHRTVDDTPAGGGAGMVMRPEPWGETLDELVGEASAPPTMVVPTPAGKRFTQALAAELATEPWLLFASSRYEGIDQRVVAYASQRMRVRELSIGDYVLNGGEAAVLVMVEAVARLVPGVVGNPDSLTEESHGDSGLLEAPLYTKPARWRGLDVPDVLLSGDHAKVAAWRREQAELRTAQRRPDLLPPAAIPGGVVIGPAEPGDAGELLTLQRACWVTEQAANPDIDFHALTEPLAEVLARLRRRRVLVARSAGGRLVGSVAGDLRGTSWHVGRLMVVPDLQGRGIGRELLARIEDAAPPEAVQLSLSVGAGSTRNLRIYKKAGYRVVRTDPPGIVRLTKLR